MCAAVHESRLNKQLLDPALRVPRHSDPVVVRVRGAHDQLLVIAQAPTLIRIIILADIMT